MLQEEENIFANLPSGALIPDIPLYLPRLLERDAAEKTRARISGYFSAGRGSFKIDGLRAHQIAQLARQLVRRRHDKIPARLDKDFPVLKPEGEANLTFPRVFCQNIPHRREAVEALLLSG